MAKRTPAAKNKRRTTRPSKGRATRSQGRARKVSSRGAEHRAAKRSRSTTSSKTKASTTRKKRRATKATRSTTRLWRHVLAVLALVTVLAAGAFAYLRFAFSSKLGPSRTSTARIEWTDSLSGFEAAHRIAALGLSDAPWRLGAYFAVRGSTDCWVRGGHLLPKQVSPQQLHALVCRTLSRPSVKVTIPEGFNRFDIAARLHRKAIVDERDFLAATERRVLLAEYGIETGSSSFAETAEGHLFPATYTFVQNEDAVRVVRRLLSESTKRWWRLASNFEQGQKRLKEQFGFGRQEIITLASMVEKEAVVDDERERIAGVFLNRLRDPGFTPKLLQSDPTAMYGCLALGKEVGSCRGYAGKASPAINRDPSNLFSTYVNEGLPPGPIANPGEASIRAVLAAEPSRFFYFVAKGKGRHHFSETYAEHRRAVARLRRSRTAK